MVQAQPDGVTFWGDAVGQRTRFGPSGAGARTTIGGVVVGIDKALDGDSLIGVAIGAADLGTDTAASSHAGGDLILAAIYGGARRGRAFVDWQVDYLHMDQDLSRPGGLAGSQVRSQNTLKGVGAQIDAGLDLVVGKWRVEPSLGLSALGLRSTATNESAGAALAQRVEGQSNHSLQSLVGVRFARTIRPTPEVSIQVNGLAGWGHEMGDTRAEAGAGLVNLGATTFTVASAPTGRDAAHLGAGFSAQVTPTTSFHGSYAAELAHNRTSQDLAVGLRMRW
jgi:subtilase-type serine protease